MTDLPLQPVCQIDIGNELVAIIDSDDSTWISEFNWHPVRHGRCWYAETTIGRGVNFKIFSMHRMIAKTPRGQVCHHRNRNSLDNRASNLLNMLRDDHTFLHKNDTLLIKFDQSADPTTLGLGRF